MQPTSGWRRRPGLITNWPTGIEAIVLLMPSMLMASVIALVSEAQRPVLGVRIAVSLAIALIGWMVARGRIPLSATTLTASLPLLIWLELDTTTLSNGARQLVLGLAWLIPGLVLVGDLIGSSVLAHLRPAHFWTKTILAREEWPRTVVEIHQLPEVIGLRDAILEDALPALHVLLDPRRPVQLAALATLEGRNTWQPGQAELVLRYLQAADDSTTRAAAIRALAWIDDVRVVETLIGYLGDPSHPVRQAAMESLLCKPERRWPVVRQAIHVVLTDPRFAQDGPLNWFGPVLPLPAVLDLLIWSAEGGVVAPRATETLMRHYRQALTDGNAREVFAELQARISDPKLAAVFRIEAAQFLREHDALDGPLLERMLSPNEPTPLRLLAVDVLLSRDANSPSVETLREIARQPNREIALYTASIVQRCLQIDLGLPRNQPTPPLHTREAAEVTRRVMQWAHGEYTSPAAGMPTERMSMGSFGSLVIRPPVPLVSGTPLTNPPTTASPSTPDLTMPDPNATPPNPPGTPPTGKKPTGGWDW